MCSTNLSFIDFKLTPWWWFHPIHYIHCNISSPKGFKGPLEVRTSPPSRSEASRTVTCAWGRLRCSSRAQVRPETPGGTGRSSWKAKPWLQTCSIFVGSFSQCLNLVESGHKAGNIGTTECPSENARPHHITPPPTMQNLGAAISLWQLQNAHIHECFGTVIPWCSQLQVMDTINVDSTLTSKEHPRTVGFFLPLWHCFDTFWYTAGFQAKRKLTETEAADAGKQTSASVLHRSPTAVGFSLNTILFRIRWRAMRSWTRANFDILRTSNELCHHVPFFGERNCKSLRAFFLSRNQSPKSCIAAWTEHTHAAICMWLKQNKQMYTNVIICQLTTSIYVNLLQQWIWICWISVYHRIDYQKGIWHIKHHQNICSIQQLFFRGLRLKFHIVSRKTMFRYSESFGFQLRCPRRSASTSRCICSSFACNLGTELGLADPDSGALKIMHPLNCLCIWRCGKPWFALCNQDSNDRVLLIM